MNTLQSLLLFTLISSALAQFCLAPNATGFILEAAYSCAQGFYCPNTNASDPYSLPQLCPPTIDCQIERLGGKFCEPQGKYEPSPCPKGYFCPTFTEKYECPEGYYCPIGSFKPHECTPMTSCPPKSNTSFFYGAIVIIVIVDGFLAASFFAYKFYLKKTNKIVKTGENETIADFASQIRPMKMDFRFDRMKYVLKDGRVILDNVTGDIRSGRVTAIMGPSGSGKTTFLSVLMGKVARTGGSLYINGKEEEMYKFKKIIGFVPQDDIMLRELTVRENIAFSARVRLPNWDSPRIEKLVDAVISSLNLSHVENIPIGDESKRGVSGGQRKRVNIGIELAAGPSVVFLDEPTSGLDSTQALQVANIMKQMASIGMTVASVIHQPRYEIFKAFDDIILLCPGGKVAYIGPVTQVEKYFTSLGYKFDPRENPADVLMDIISGNKVTEAGEKIQLDKVWSERSQDFDESPTMEQFEVVVASDSPAEPIPISDRGAPFWKQVYLNHNRYMLQQYRTWTSFVLEVGVASLAGLLMGISTMGNAGSLYSGILIEPYTLLSPSPVEFVLPLSGLLNGIAVGLSGAPAGVKTFGEEKVLYWREAAAGHSKLAYFIGKSICTFYRFSVTSLHFSMFYYVLSRPLITFAKFYFIIFLMFYCVYGLSTVISMVVRRENSSLLAVVVCLFAGVFNGFGPSLKDARSWGIGFIWEISYARWGTEALYNEEVDMVRHVYQVDNISSKNWGYTLDRYAMDVGMMIVIGFVYRIIAYLLMVFLNRRKTK